MAIGDNTETTAALVAALKAAATAGGQAAASAVETVHNHHRHTATAQVNLAGTVAGSTAMNDDVATLLAQLDARYAAAGHTHT